MNFLIGVLISTVVSVGAPLPEWQQGYLDIHAINSARGECTFFIFPDGTTMLVDAGELVRHNTSKYEKVPSRPCDDITPAEVYVRYIRHFLPKKAHGRLDYAVVSHYHADHIGRVEEQMPVDPKRGYKLTGIAAVEAQVPIRKLIDRAWPDFEASRLEDTSGGSVFYPDFVNYACKHDGMKAESFKVGSSKQIRLRHSSCRYRDFRIFNYAASGWVWNGEKAVYVYGDKPMRENGASCCFLLSYGDFDYYSGGDAGGNSPVALPVAKSIGRPIEAMKADHHMSYHTMKDETMSILRPKVIVTQSFFERDIQPDYTVVDRILSDDVYPGAKYLYFTNIGPQQQAAHADVYSRVAGMNGHVVIRVMPGGHDFYVIMLDDTDFNYTIKSIDGPFKCK